MILARRRGDDHRIDVAPALAICLAVSLAYVLVFGWPAGHAPGSQAKSLLAAFIGAAIGLSVESRGPWSRILLAAGAVSVCAWIGIPAWRHGGLESAHLLLPIAVALAIPALIGRRSSTDHSVEILTLLSMAFGIAAIAFLAKTLSFATLGMALGGALIALLAIGGGPMPISAVVTAAYMILALITALLLYSEASPLSLLVLAAATAAAPLTRLTGGSALSPAVVGRVIVFSLLPAAAGILIARIDAGPVSIY